MFKSSSDRLDEADEYRKFSQENKLSFGIAFLDQAMRGITPDDVILLSAGSGAGKTQAAIIIAIANLMLSKKVYFFALEAAKAEHENRMRYSHVIKFYTDDPKRPNLGKIDYSDWVTHGYGGRLERYERDAKEYCREMYKNLFTYYKQDHFTLSDLMEEVALCSDDADLIIIDHAHFFSYGDKTEAQGLKEIIEGIRKLAHDHKVPFLVLAHMRKRDKGNGDLVPAMEEIHGSSDLFKMATKVITMAGGKPTEDGRYETYMRICKDRHDSGVTRYIARHLFDPKNRNYDDTFILDWAERDKKHGFEFLDEKYYPHWAKRKRS